MAQTKFYQKLKIYIDGTQQLEAQSITVNVDSQLQEVITMENGFSGVTPGASRIEVSGTFAVSAKSGLEFDIYKASMELTSHAIQIDIGGGKQIKFTGIFRTSGISASANANTEAQFSIIGACDADVFV